MFFLGGGTCMDTFGNSYCWRRVSIPELSAVQYAILSINLMLKQRTKTCLIIFIHRWHICICHWEIITVHWNLLTILLSFVDNILFQQITLWIYLMTKKSCFLTGPFALQFFSLIVIYQFNITALSNFNLLQPPSVHWIST